MRVVLVGHGAREHCIARRLVKEGAELACISTRSHPGLASFAAQVKQVDAYRAPAIARFAKSVGADMVFPTHEDAIFAGLVDECRAIGVVCIGPSLLASAIERDRAIAVKALEQGGLSDMLAGTKIIHQESDSDTISESLYPTSVCTKSLISGYGHTFERHPSIEAALHQLPRLTPCLLERDTPGLEFSLHCLSDGGRRQYPLCTIDYPYTTRTGGVLSGGMGGVSEGPWPSALPSTLRDQCRAAAETIWKALPRRVSTTANGFYAFQFRYADEHLYFTEVEAKPRSPEFIHFLLSYHGCFLGLLRGLAAGNAPTVRCDRSPVVSVAYVPRGYPMRKLPPRYTQGLDMSVLQAADIFIGDCGERDGTITPRVSRTLIATGRGETLPDARSLAYANGAHWGGELVCREDIGDFESGLIPTRPRLNRGKSAARRVAESTKRLRETGGSRKTYRFSRQATRAIRSLMLQSDAPATETALIEKLLKEANRNRST